MLSYSWSQRWKGWKHAKCAKWLYIPFFVNVHGYGILRITRMWMTTTNVFELEDLSEGGTTHMKWVWFSTTTAVFFRDHVTHG